MNGDELTPIERAFAESFKMSYEEYAAYKSSDGGAAWEAQQAAKSRESEHDRIKAAVAEALAEHERTRRP